jgi:hypothetical protein
VQPGLPEPSSRHPPSPALAQEAVELAQIVEIEGIFYEK